MGEDFEGWPIDPWPTPLPIQEASMEQSFCNKFAESVIFGQQESNLAAKRRYAKSI